MPGGDNRSDGGVLAGFSKYHRKEIPFTHLHPNLKPMTSGEETQVGKEAGGGLDDELDRRRTGKQSSRDDHHRHWNDGQKGSLKVGIPDLDGSRSDAPLCETDVERMA